MKNKNGVMKMKKIMFGILIVGIMSGFSNVNKFCIAQETKKVLVLHIIEENWDDLEFIGPKIKRPGNYKLPTKKEVIKFRRMDMEENKEEIIKDLKLYLSTGEVPKNLKVFISHTIKYFGKANELKDGDVLEEAIYRFAKLSFIYYYERFPEEILLLTVPQIFDMTKQEYEPYTWGNFKEIRLVGNIYILYKDNYGNLKIKYNEIPYNLKAGNKVQFPTKVANLKKNEMVDFINKIEKTIGTKSRSYLHSIVSSKDIFYFKTKVTLINYGYIKIE